MWTAGDQAFWEHLAGHSSTPLDMPGTRRVPHVLKDGADSIGLGALVRV
jgi:hypothetical protein